MDLGSEWKEFMSFIESKLDILVFLISIFFIVLMFIDYLFATSGQKFPNQAWDFFNSKAFYLIIIAVLAPVLVNYIRNVNQKKEEAIKEKKKEIYDGIEKTDDTWRELINLTGKVRYYHHETPIESLHMDLDDFRVKMSEIRTIWHFYFSNLKKLEPERHFCFSNLKKLEPEYFDYLDLLYEPMYVLFSSANTVVQLIHDNQLFGNQSKSYEKERRDHQFLLGAIQTTINNIYHKSILIILRKYLDMEYGNKEAKKNAEDEIRSNLEYMKWLYNNLGEIEIENDVFSFLEEKPRYCWWYKEERSEKCKENFKHLADGFKRCENDLRENRKGIKKIENKEVRKCFRKYCELKELDNTEEKEVKRCFYSISPPYSKECMIKLANFLDCLDMSRDLKKRAEWPIFIDYHGDEFSLQYPFIWRENKSPKEDKLYKCSSDKNDCEFKVLSYNNCLEGCLCFLDEGNISSVKKEYLNLYNSCTGKSGEKTSECEKISQNGDECRDIFKCNKKKDNSKIQGPYYKDIKLLINDKNVYFLDLTVSQNYYESNKSMINRTMHSFKLKEKKRTL